MPASQPPVRRKTRLLPGALDELAEQANREGLEILIVRWRSPKPCRPPGPGGDGVEIVAEACRMKEGQRHAASLKRMLETGVGFPPLAFSIPGFAPDEQLSR